VEVDLSAYAALAGFYDAMKSGEDYDAWADALLEPVRRFGTGGNRLLDVGCGTGLSSSAFQRCGFEVTGCDSASEMLAVARAGEDATGIEFVSADARRLPPELGRFDVVTWMDDVANHLLSAEDLLSALRSSKDRLRPGGLLVFDANSSSAFETLATNTVVLEQPDSFFALSGEPVADGRARLRAVGFVRTGELWRRHEAVVDERHYADAELRGLLVTAGLEPLAVYGWTGEQLVTPPDENEHVKLVYVAR
jgi:SAM-dependent methyltransferase